jgi:hypothetical protein
MANRELAGVWKIWAATEGAAKTLEAFHITPNLRPLKRSLLEAVYDGSNKFY